jgi:hypothetical protein
MLRQYLFVRHPPQFIPRSLSTVVHCAISTWQSVTAIRPWTSVYIHFSFHRIMMACSLLGGFQGSESSFCTRTLINDQPYVQFIIYIFISILYMFRATLCSSSGESFVSIQHLVYVNLCRWPYDMQVGKEIPDLHTGRSPTYTRCRIYTIDSPDDEHKVARNI